jgi:competence protein ComEC
LSNDVVAYLSAVTGQLLGEPQASLLNGILFGTQAKLPPDLSHALRVSGTLHVVAVSGQNMSILAGFLGKATAIFGAKVSLVLQAFGIILYIFLVGGGASVIRSGLMALIALFAVVTGRQADSGRALIATSLVMIVVRPAFLTDVGWQLSVAATAGIIWFEPSISRLLQRLPKMLAAPLAVSLAAQAFTWPIIVYNFGIVSLLSLPANILVEWSVPWIMLLGMAATLAGVVFLPLGSVLAWLAWVPLTFFVIVVQKISEIPGASFNYQGFPLGLMVSYFSLLSFGVWKWSRKAPR